jgi:hypothetical protein
MAAGALHCRYAPFAQQHEVEAVGREYEPKAGQWYDNLDEDTLFRVVRVDEDEGIITLHYEDDDEAEEIDLDSWYELDLELSAAPAVPSDYDEEDEWDDEEEDDDEDDEDDDWDDDDEDDDDDDDPADDDDGSGSSRKDY